MRLPLLLPLVALQAAASPWNRRQTNSTAPTNSTTPVNATTATITTTLTQTTITTFTSLTTETAHTTVTDHTLVTDHVTETAYVIATLPPCVDAKAIEPFTTLSGAKPSPTENTGSFPSSGSGAPSSGSSIPNNNNPNSSPSSSTPAGTPVIVDADHNSPSTDAAASAAPILYPIVPPSVDTTSKDVLIPKAEGSLTYTENGISDPEIEHIFAKVNANYTYPTVVLPYTTAVSSVSCVSNGLAVTFNTTKSYDFVKSNWSTYNGTGFMIITDDKCSTSTAQQGMHAYWLVKELRYDDAKKTVTVVAVEIAVEDAFKNVQIIWGTYTPPGSSGTPNVIINGTVGTPGTSSGGSGPFTPGSNGTAPTNGTSTRDPYANSTLSCLNPPSTYLGLPTAPCGNDFDYDLDQRIGTINMTDQAALNRFGPGFGDAALTKRWWNPLAKLREAAERIARAAADAARRAAAAVAQAAEAAARKIKEAAEAAARALSNPSFNSNIPISVRPGGLRDSPFGTANSLLLFHGDTQGKNGRAAVDLYCVDCGITGAAKLNGEIQYTLLPPSVNKAVVSLNGNIKAEVALGLYAEGEYSKEVTNNLLTVPIPGAGIKVGNLLTIGVVMSLDAKAKLDVKAEGKVLIGASVSLPDFRASFDALSSAGRQISGFEPVFEKRFDASGTIDAKLDLGLPMEIAVGINVPPISFKKQVGVRNTPGIEAGATVAVNIPDAACNNGVSYYISAYNNLDLNLFGSVDRLYGFRKDKIFSDCVKIPGLPVSQPAPDTAAPAPVTTPEGTNTPPPAEGTKSPTEGAQPAQDKPPAQDPATAPAQDPAPAKDVPATQDPAPVSTPPPSGDNSAAPANDEGKPPASPATRRARRFHHIAERQNATVTTATTNSTIPAQNNSTSTPIVTTGNTTAMTNSTTSTTTSNSTSPAANSTASLEDLLGKEAPDAKVGDGYTAVTIKEISGDYVFAYDDSTGNFFFDEAKEAAEYPFGGSDDIVSAAKGEDLLYYYPDEMAALGVSRFRTGPLEEAPATSSLIILGSYASNEGNVLVPVAGMTDEVFNLIYCQLDGLTDKIFLAKDVDAGIATLMKPETAFVVTGGLVQECFPVALRSPFKAI